MKILRRIKYQDKETRKKEEKKKKQEKERKRERQDRQNKLRRLTRDGEAASESLCNLSSALLRALHGACAPSHSANHSNYRDLHNRQNKIGQCNR